jgi:threonylcarbamoyladenosine tRNA methylthiotransferase MtaB
MNKVAVATLGCKVNQVETSTIIQQLIELGFQIVPFAEPADIYIINTCTVTNRTDFKSRSLIRQAKLNKLHHPNVRIIVTGCYAQKERQELESMGGIDLIVDNQDKVNLEAWFDNQNYRFHDICQAETLYWKTINGMHQRTRAFIKVQDGCDYFCSYCAVPYGRGKPRSLSSDEVINQTRILIQAGYKEIVLTGVNLGLYRDKTNDIDLAEILKVIVNIDHRILFRISSIEPDLWSDSLLGVITDNQNICPHFHIPAQSGSDQVLKAMKRRYDVQLIKGLVNQLTSDRKDCAIGLDIICGFPGETKEDFAATYTLIQELPITYLHVFGYSKRKSTPAAIMQNQVNGNLVRQRVHNLMELGKLKKSMYRDKLIKARTLVSGVTEKVDNKTGSCLSDHYLRAYKTSESICLNSILEGAAVRQYKDGILID